MIDTKSFLLLVIVVLISTRLLLADDESLPQNNLNETVNTQMNQLNQTNADSIMNDVNEEKPVVPSEPESLQKTKQDDYKYVDPKAKDGEKAWAYPTEPVNWKYQDVKKKETQEQKAIQQNTYGGQSQSAMENSIDKNFKEHPKESDLKFKPANIIKHQSITNSLEDKNNSSW